MKLYNIKLDPPLLIADIDDDYQVRYMHPVLKRAIEIQQGAAIPAIRNLMEQFKGRIKIPSDDPQFGKALIVHLDIEYASHRDTYQWIKGASKT